MVEVKGNLWTYPANARVITTNGTVKKDGSCVMGRGCALEAKTKFPGIDKELGKLIKLHGNHVRILIWDHPNIWSFPVKHNWWEKADLELIRRSAKELVNIADVGNYTKVVLPRPGCGNGGLKWEDVKPVIEPILDDRFHVISW